MHRERPRRPLLSHPARDALRLLHVLLGLARCCQPGPRGGPHGGCPIEVSTAYYFYGTCDEAAKAGLGAGERARPPPGRTRSDERGLVLEAALF
jgi:hypothetical protein